MSTLPPGLRDRVLAEAAKAPKAAPGTFSRRVVSTVLVVTLWMGVTTWVMGIRPDLHDLPLVYSIGTFAALVLGAGTMSRLGVARGRSMLGPPVWVLMSMAIALPLVVSLWSYVVPSPVPTSLGCGTQAQAMSFAPKCALITLALATPVLGAMLWLRRGMIAASPALTGACLGAAAATWAHLVQHAHCPVANPMHVLMGHALPIVPVMIISAIVGRKVFR